MRYELPQHRRWRIAPAAVLIMVGLVMLRGAALASEPARVTQACLDCHDDRDASLAATPHAVATGKDDPKARVACTDCHSGDARHAQGEPRTYPMSNPAKLAAQEEARLCSGCHSTSHQQNMSERNAHARSGIACSGCHQVHGSANRALLVKTEPALCLSCHAQVEGDFAKTSRHPVPEGIVRCSECHMSLDTSRRPQSFERADPCGKCHAEFAGPFVHEHPATLDFSTDEGGCLACHEPHGSHLPRLLKQPYEAPNFQLCTQCHSVPGHQANPMHGTQWAGMPCNDCHTDIHGSNTSRFFLSASLEGRGCFNVGCHRF